MAEFAQILIRAKDETKAAFDSASRNMRGLEATASKLGGLMRGVGIGAGLSVAGLAVFAKSGIDAADSLNDMSQRLGVSVKDLASFKLAAEQSGTSLDGVGAGIARLTRSIGEAEGGNKKLAGALGQLGVTARDPKEAFFQLADAVERIQDPAKRAALLSQVLGKSYQDLVPLLNQGGDALRESARQSESFADAMAKLAPDADKFNDQLAALKINAAGLSGELLLKLVPALNEVFERISLVKNLTAAGGLFNTVAITAGTSEISTVMRRLKDDIKETQAAITDERGKGKDTTGFEEKLRGLNAQLVVMKENSRNAALALGDQFKNYKVPQTPSDAAKIKTPSPAKTTRSATDPLSSLLGSTDIGKLAAFDKTVAQLNARFDGGRKNAELYTQAMTKLVETTFSANFTEFNKQLAEQDETQRLTAEHLKATNDEIFAQQQAWADAGAALEDEMRTPLENANIEFGRLQDLLDRGVISWETYTRAVLKTQDAIEETPKKLEGMDTFAKKFAENAQDTFADFFKNFDQGTDGMLKKFGDTVKGLIAEAVAADLTKRLFGGLADNGATSGSGWAGAALNWIGGLFASANGNAFMNAPALSAYSGSVVSRPTLFPFASGIGLMGEAGAEAILPLKRGSDGKLGVSSGGGGGHTVNVYVNGNSAPDVRNAAGQVGRSVLSALEGARRYG